MAMASLGTSEYTKRRGCKYTNSIMQYSLKYEVDPVLITSIMYVESGFNPSAVSRANACGLMQTIPKWNPEFVNGERKFYTCEELFVPKRNIRVGVRAYTNWLRAAGGNRKMALCAYNAGRQCMKKDANLETIYVKRVLAAYNTLMKEIFANILPKLTIDALKIF